MKQQLDSRRTLELVGTQERETVQQKDNNEMCFPIIIMLEKSMMREWKELRGSVAHLTFTLSTLISSASLSCSGGCDCIGQFPVGLGAWHEECKHAQSANRHFAFSHRPGHHAMSVQVWGCLAKGHLDRIHWIQPH